MSGEELPEGIAIGNIDGFLKKEFLYKFSLDTWVNNESLRDCTFETKMVPMTCDEGKALLRLNQQWSRAKYEKIELTSQEESLIRGLETKIDNAILEMGGLAFVKLNHRSPKDVVMLPNNEKLRNIFVKKLTYYATAHTIDNKTEFFVRAVALWNEAATRSLCVTSGREALTLFSQSYRINTDLNADVEYPQFFKSQIAVRKVEKVAQTRAENRNCEVIDLLKNKQIDPAFEFRGFISNNVFTALSQYEPGIFSQDLSGHQNKVATKIVQFWETQIKPNITLSSYVIDFCFIWNTDSDKKTQEDIQNATIKIVELNPFHAHTSGSLFSWKNDRDVIMNGPFEMRVTTKAQESPLEALPTVWANEVEEIYKAKRKIIPAKNIILFSTFALVVGIFAYWYMNK